MAHFGLRLGCWQRDCSATNGGPLELDRSNKGTGSSIRVDALWSSETEYQSCFLIGWSHDFISDVIVFRPVLPLFPRGLLVCSGVHGGQCCLLFIL